ncbi:hypothetical protein BAUCODRAFT_126337 [Baudoinia panamericana UAMH 10762]|uniref:Uncharacterized protein n=1 Tax=Baudoinia panamericana (strain UAMH 10762) TaxID=717646 RepID=M2N137_BAUPA|nr:uncharacterized protein BAUCODRAFT_126337 [Baudoinia panamericana UAMH 10762]EMC92350.1 hypothetical protein BAUCODRAFT_126337 [Baudoinia panamericana UAMH 10762]
MEGTASARKRPADALAETGESPSKRVKRKYVERPIWAHLADGNPRRQLDIKTDVNSTTPIPAKASEPNAKTEAVVSTPRITIKLPVSVDRGPGERSPRKQRSPLNPETVKQASSRCNPATCPPSSYLPQDDIPTPALSVLKLADGSANQSRQPLPHRKQQCDEAKKKKPTALLQSQGNHSGSEQSDIQRQADTRCRKQRRPPTGPVVSGSYYRPDYERGRSWHPDG